MTASADYLAMATDKKHQAEKLRRQAAGLDDEAVSLREKYDSSPGVVKARETASLLSKRKAVSRVPRTPGLQLDTDGFFSRPPAIAPPRKDQHIQHLIPPLSILPTSLLDPARRGRSRT